MQQQQGQGQVPLVLPLLPAAALSRGPRQAAETRTDRELDELLGNVPYLNGGLFDVHELEARNDDDRHPRRGLRELFDFFDAYHWHLDERPLRADNEINPDVLGYIFEKYINQKQMGAYYTKEDITEYISKNTIIPFLLRRGANGVCRSPSSQTAPSGGCCRTNPDRYIYAAVQQGVDRSAAGGDRGGLERRRAQRDGWNQPAPDEFALPTETWREHVARRQRYRATSRRDWSAGEVQRRSTTSSRSTSTSASSPRTSIDNCEGPELLRAFYQRHSSASPSSTPPAAPARSCSPRSTSSNRSTRPAWTGWRRSSTSQRR